MPRLATATSALLFSAAGCVARPPETPPIVTPPPTVTAAPTAPSARSLVSPKPPGPCQTIPPEECGRWETPPLERWRDAMEGYRSALPPNPHAIGTRAVPLARYMNGVHNRVHVWFADRFLESLDKLPKDDPRNASTLATTIEIAIAPDGRIARMGVVQPSGVPAFDASGLESFARAAPFDPTPEEIRSLDGNVWLHWQVRRDEVFACSTMNARPFLFGPGA